MLDTALSLRLGWMNTETPGAYVLQISFFILAIIAPCLQLIFAVWTWFFPSRFSYFMLETFSLWASLDVFVVAILASVLALTEYTSYMIGDSCNAINSFLVNHLANSLDEPTCIDLTSTLLPGVYVLIAGCLLMVLVTLFILSRQNEYGEEEKDEEEDKNEEKHPLILN